MKDYVVLIQDCETKVREGRIEEVQKTLGALNTAQVPRSSRLALANLCRRSGLLNVGLRLLAPVVHPERRPLDGTEARPEELAEYGVLLQKSGAIREALWTLKKAGPMGPPEVLLYRAFCHFSIWDYVSAAHSLREFLDKETRPYQSMVGRVNYAAALVALGEREAALAFLNETIAESDAQNYHRLAANGCELRAQVHFQMGRYAQARVDLERASTLLNGGSRSTDNFFVTKWSAIIEGFEKENLEPILKFRALAEERKHWESVREADRFLLQVTFDADRFDHLLFGTPFPSYRDSMMNEHGRGPSSSEFLLGSDAGPVLYLGTGSIRAWDKAASLVSPGRGCHRLVEVLMRDFYRPLPVGALFAELYPDEHFDVFTSIHRIHQLIYRTRAWLEETGLPLSIPEEAGSYRVKVGEDFGVIVPFDRKTVSKEDLHVSVLKGRFGEEEFSSKAARDALGISSTAFKGLMSWAMENGRVVREGAARATRYRIAA